MFSPVGSRPPSVYWRRRIMLFGSLVLLVLLIVLTLRAVAGGNGAPAANGSTTGSGAPTATSPSSGQSTSSQAGTTPGGSSAKPSPTPQSSGKPSSAAVAAARCRSADLGVQAVVAKKAYKVGDEPMVELEVTNTGATPCVQDLADRQIELKVYNGESRVWASHDCEIQAGTDDRTLAVNRPVRVSITWSGLTSQPKCAGTRQRVGAGTYTLYAVLSGKNGKATQFSIG